MGAFKSVSIGQEPSAVSPFVPSVSTYISSLQSSFISSLFGTHTHKTTGFTAENQTTGCSQSLSSLLSCSFVHSLFVFYHRFPEDLAICDVVYAYYVSPLIQTLRLAGWGPSDIMVNATTLFCYSSSLLLKQEYSFPAWKTGMEQHMKGQGRGEEGNHEPAVHTPNNQTIVWHKLLFIANGILGGKQDLGECASYGQETLQIRVL